MGGGLLELSLGGLLELHNNWHIALDNSDIVESDVFKFDENSNQLTIQT